MPNGIAIDTNAPIRGRSKRGQGFIFHFNPTKAKEYTKLKTLAETKAPISHLKPSPRRNIANPETSTMTWKITLAMLS